MGIDNIIMKKKITFISDTHNKHKHLTSKGMGNILGSGDILVHAGDSTSMGQKHEINEFLKWFSNTDFEHKIFIAGNHDFGFEQQTDIDQEFKDLGVTYLFDNDITIDEWQHLLRQRSCAVGAIEDAIEDEDYVCRLSAGFRSIQMSRCKHEPRTSRKHRPQRSQH